MGIKEPWTAKVRDDNNSSDRQNTADDADAESSSALLDTAIIL